MEGRGGSEPSMESLDNWLSRASAVRVRDGFTVAATAPQRRAKGKMHSITPHRPLWIGVEAAAGPLNLQGR